MMTRMLLYFAMKKIVKEMMLLHARVREDR